MAYNIWAGVVLAIQCIFYFTMLLLVRYAPPCTSLVFVKIRLFFAMSPNRPVDGNGGLLVTPAGHVESQEEDSRKHAES